MGPNTNSVLIFCLLAVLTLWSQQGFSQEVPDEPIYLLWDDEEHIMRSDSSYVSANDSLYLKARYIVTMYGKDFLFSHLEFPYSEEKNFKQFFTNVEVLEKPLTFLDSVALIDANWFRQRSVEEVTEGFKNVEQRNQKAFLIYKSDVEDEDDIISLLQVKFVFVYDE